jgi:hypothetical protein
MSWRMLEHHTLTTRASLLGRIYSNEICVCVPVLIFCVFGCIVGVCVVLWVLCGLCVYAMRVCVSVSVCAEQVASHSRGQPQQQQAATQQSNA